MNTNVAPTHPIGHCLLTHPPTSPFNLNPSISSSFNPNHRSGWEGVQTPGIVSGGYTPPFPPSNFSLMAMRGRGRRVGPRPPYPATPPFRLQAWDGPLAPAPRPRPPRRRRNPRSMPTHPDPNSDPNTCPPMRLGAGGRGRAISESGGGDALAGEVFSSLPGRASEGGGCLQSRGVGEFLGGGVVMIWRSGGNCLGMRWLESIRKLFGWSLCRCPWGKPRFLHLPPPFSQPPILSFRSRPTGRFSWWGPVWLFVWLWVVFFPPLWGVWNEIQGFCHPSAPPPLPAPTDRSSSHCTRRPWTHVGGWSLWSGDRGREGSIQRMLFGGIYITAGRGIPFPPSPSPPIPLFSFRRSIGPFFFGLVGPVVVLLLFL